MRRTFPGTGLSFGVYFAALTASVAVFFFWGGALWAAPIGTSHVGRFAASYLIVIPLAAAALTFSRSWSWSHLVGTTGSMWAIKLLVTAISYEAVIHRPAHEPPAVHASPQGEEAAAPTGCLEQKEARARVVEIVLPLDHAPAQPAVYTVDPDDSLRFVNRNTRLHTARLTDASGAAVLNVPVPPGATVTAPAPEESGAYLLRCGAHPEEATVIHIQVPEPRPCLGTLAPSAPALQRALAR